MNTRPKNLYSETIVRFQDCDPYSHLNNSSYLDYFMNAREDQLLKFYDLDIYGLIRTEGVAWVVAQNQIAYFEPALLMEKLSITTRLIAHAPRKVKVEFLMRRVGGERIKALLWSEFAYFDLKTQKSREHEEKYRQLFEEVILPIPESGFTERVAALKANGLMLPDA